MVMRDHGGIDIRAHMGWPVTAFKPGDRVGYATAKITIGAYTEVRLFPAELVYALWQALGAGGAALAAGDGGRVSSVRAIGRVLFTDYALAFEVTSLLILVAMVGAVVLAKRRT